MAGKQVVARLHPTAKTKFDGYATRLGLDSSELAKLLIIREQHQRQLLRRFRGGGLIKAARRAKVQGVRLPTITAHFSSEDYVTQFDLYVSSFGMGRGAAAAILFEAEIEERWLEKAIAEAN